MGYDDSDAMAHKTGRIAIFAILIFALGGFFFAYKVNACADKPTRIEPCKDEFFQVDNDHPAHACSTGAKAEWVTSPPAPKPGIICHCVNEVPPAASSAPR